jgi:hypothetical protein
VRQRVGVTERSLGASHLPLDRRAAAARLVGEDLGIKAVADGIAQRRVQLFCSLLVPRRLPLACLVEPAERLVVADGAAQRLGRDPFGLRGGIGGGGITAALRRAAGGGKKGKGCGRGEAALQQEHKATPRR